MNYPAPQIEVVANDIPNPFDENNECGASQAPKSSCKSLNISDDTQIQRKRRYKGYSGCTTCLLLFNQRWNRLLDT